MMENGCFLCDTARGCTEISAFPTFQAISAKGGVGSSCVIDKQQVRTYSTEKAAKTSTNKIIREWEEMNSQTENIRPGRDNGKNE